MAKDKFGDVFNCTDTCALTGAAAFFAGIPKAYIVANGPLWCYFYALRYLERVDHRLERRFIGTQPDNNSVVYGTEECLLTTLHTIKEQEYPSIVLVENSCAVGLIGDDIAGISRKAELACPVVCFDSGGLKGGFSQGFKLAGKNFLESFELAERKTIKPFKVNLLGAGVGYYNAENDLNELKFILGLVGLEVGVALGAGSSLDEIKNMTEASLNIVIHDELGLEQAMLLQEKYNIPYFSAGVPYGINGTKKWINKLSECIELKLVNLNEYCNEIEKKMTARINDIKSTWGDLWFEQGIISAPSSVVLGLAEALRLEWADMAKLTVILQDKPVELPECDWIDTLLTIESKATEIEDAMNGLTDGILLASSSEVAVVQRRALRNVLTCNIANPVQNELLLNREPFMGINGSVNMLQRIWNKKIDNKMKENGF